MSVTICLRFKKPLIALLTAILLLGSAQLAGAEKTAMKSQKGSSAKGGDNLQRRIDFGNSYILGQSIKSGAVYLLHRKKSEIKSMLHYREHYRDEILSDFSVDADHELGLKQSDGVETETLKSKNKKAVLK
jgi:hypothetical protein